MTTTDASSTGLPTGDLPLQTGDTPKEQGSTSSSPAPTSKDSPDPEVKNETNVTSLNPNPPVEAEPSATSTQPQTQNSKSQTSNSKPQTSPMEVHKHPHDITHPKRWTEYLLEFLMIFFAVFLGFVAENTRESIVEKRREKEYIRSFAEDLQTDIRSLSRWIPALEKRKQRLDSFNAGLVHISSNTADLYYYARISTRTLFFTSADRTIIQLKNSGGFRLISNRRCIDSITNYENLLERYQYALSRDDEEVSHLHPYLSRIFDATVFASMMDAHNAVQRPAGNPPLLSTDPLLINEFMYYVHQLTTSITGEIQRLQRIQAKARNTLQLLTKEYQLGKVGEE